MRPLPVGAVLPALLAAPASAALSSPHIIFLHRRGGTYTPGVDDPSHNVSSAPGGTSVLPAFSGDDSAWLLLRSCMLLSFRRFDVTITDVDPGDTAHLSDAAAQRGKLTAHCAAVIDLDPSTQQAVLAGFPF
jgi:hypothetical protein